MKIGWILSGNEDVAGARIQGWNVHKSFLEKGIDSSIIYAPKGFSTNLPLTKEEIDKILELKYTHIIFQKIESGETLQYFIEALKNCRIKIIYICMDNINRLLAENADLILAVSDYLISQLDEKQRKKAKYIFDGYEQESTICKNYDDNIVKDNESNFNVNNITLVYISNNTYSSFPKIKNLPPNVKLKIIGPPEKRVHKYFPNQKIFTETTFPFEYVVWSRETVIKELLSCDVGVIPYSDKIIDTPQIKSKSNNRLIFLMSLGLPVIVSPTDEFKKIIIDGKNAFIANTEEDWIKKIENLRDSPAERKRMGLLARESVIEKYSLSKQVARIYELILGL